MTAKNVPNLMIAAHQYEKKSQRFKIFLFLPCYMGKSLTKWQCAGASEQEKIISRFLFLLGFYSFPVK